MKVENSTTISKWEQLKISILLTGSELVEGRLQDTNALFAARYLDDRGLKLKKILVCDDDTQDIITNLQYLSETSDVIIVSGGLGPTTGDKTREAIADFLGQPLISDVASLQRIKDFFAERNRTYTNNNDKQAQIPAKAEIIRNDFGTATCFATDYSKGILCALPGVPREFEPLFDLKVIPIIAKHFRLESLQLQTLPAQEIRIFGLSEAGISEAVRNAKLDNSLAVSYRATFPEVRVLIKASDSSVNEDLVFKNAESAAQQIGTNFIFSKSGLTLPEETHAALIKSGKTIAFAESCSTGLLSALIGANPGCSQYFSGSIVSYANKIKHNLLGVDLDLIKTKGAVSAEVASQMAINCQQRFGSDITVSITGIAGPDGGTEEKPVGTVFLSYIKDNQQITFRIFYPGSRERIQEYICYLALEQIRRSLLGLQGIEQLAGICRI